MKKTAFTLASAIIYGDTVVGRTYFVDSALLSAGYTGDLYCLGCGGLILISALIGAAVFQKKEML